MLGVSFRKYIVNLIPGENIWSGDDVGWSLHGEENLGEHPVFSDCKLQPKKILIRETIGAVVYLQLKWQLRQRERERELVKRKTMLDVSLIYKACRKVWIFHFIFSWPEFPKLLLDN